MSNSISLVLVKLISYIIAILYPGTPDNLLLKALR